MKKLIAILLCLAAVLSLYACGVKTPSYTATEADKQQLEALYEGRLPYQGELHDHANTGGTSDGQALLSTWKQVLISKDMDFATLADHKQVLHMRLPEWDNSLFIGGTEAATTIKDSKATQKMLHYNMLFPQPEQLEAVLTKFGKHFNYSDDHFTYPSFNTAEMKQLVQSITENGGFFVHVHPKGDSYMKSDDPLDYYFGDYSGIEVLTGYWGNMSDKRNQANYKLWTDLLALGKRVYATSGSDSHKVSNTVSLTTIYSEKKDAGAYLSHVRNGDFTAGPIGIRMSMGDTCTGGETSFAGKRLVVSVGEFHKKECKSDEIYRLDLYSDNTLVCSQEIPYGEVSYIAVDADPSVSFYRAEVYNVTKNYQVSIGNPIWNADK